jgi:hypothetical protein
MKISAVFPRGSQVCMSRSGDSPRGFYASYGKNGGKCREDRLSADASMGIGSVGAAYMDHPLLDIAAHCRPLSAHILTIPSGDSLTLLGGKSLTCQETKQDGSILITVHTLADSTDPADQGPLYWATLSTKPDRMSDDIAMFRRFLESLKLG